MATRRFAAAVVSGTLVLGSVAGMAGCASTGAPRVAPPAAATRPAVHAEARTPFEQLPPLPALPPATQPTERAVDPETRRHFRSGLSAARTGQYADAILEFKAAIEVDPAYFEARRELGRAALQSGQFDLASSALHEAARLRPRDPQVHYLLGLTAYLREDAEVAMRHLRHALALASRDDDRIKALFYLARVLERQGYCQAAVDVSSRFEALRAAGVTGGQTDTHWRQVMDSQAWRVPMVRGECLRRLGKPREAAQAYEAAIQLAPGRTEVILALAETLIDTGDTGRAVALASEVLAKDPHDSTALAILAGTLAAEGRLAELQDRLLSLVRQDPTDLVLAQRSATIFLKFGRPDAAMQTLLLAHNAADDPAALHEALLQVVFAHPDVPGAVQAMTTLLAQVKPSEQAALLEQRGSVAVNPGLRIDPAKEEELLARTGLDRTRLLSLAVVADAAGKPFLSEKALRRILQQHPDDVPVAVMLAERLIEQCRWQDVIAFVTPLLEKHKQEPAFYRLLGTAHDGLDDLKVAMSHFYEALKRDKRDVQSMWLAAQINDRLGQAEPGVAIYQVIVTLKPDFWPAHLALVRSYLLVGNQPAAVQHARKLKELFPDVPTVHLCMLMAETGKSIPPADRVAPLVATYPDDPAVLRTAAEAFLQEARVPAAIEMLTRLQTRRPDDPEGRLLLATALVRQMDYDLAHDVLRSLLAEHPNRRIWQFAEAELLIQAGRPAEAVPILRQLLDNPWGGEQKQVLLDRLIFALGYTGQYDTAIDRLRQELKQSPRNRTLQTRLLGVLIAADRRDQAIEYLRSWRKVEPNEPLLARLEAQLLDAQGGRQAAATVALRDWPGTPASPATQDGKSASPAETPAGEQADRNLALLAGALPPSDAVAWLTTRAWLNPPPETSPSTDMAETVASLAALVADQGRPAEAIELQRIVPSDDVEDLAQRTQWLFLAGERAQAELLLMPQVEQKNPELHARLKRLMSTYYKRLGLDRLSTEATAAVYRSNKEPTRIGEYANDLAYVWSDSGMNLPEAEDLARMAVASDPTNAAYLDTLGWVYYKLGRFDEAAAWIQRAVAVPSEGSDPVLHDHLGDVLWRLKRYAQAVAAWRKAIELYREELKTDPLRPDLREGLQLAEGKVRSVESRRRPAVAGCVGRE